MPTTLSKEEEIIYDIIRNANGKITQLEIARQAKGLGRLEEHEGHLPTNPTETTLRKVRKIIRELRIKHSLFILSDINGYWIMKERSEAIEYINRIEQTAKAQAKAWYVTYSAMKRNFGITSNYFESIQKEIEFN